MKKRTTRIALSLLFLTAILLIAVFLWARRTVEYRVVIGSPEQRVELCRSLPKISQYRQNWALRRLLQDPDADVRSSAITAVRKGAHCSQATDLILTMAKSSAEPREIRAKAGHFLLESKHSAYLKFLKKEIKKRDFRRRFPALSAACLSTGIGSATDQQLLAIFNMALDSQEPAAHELSEEIKNHAGKFRPVRDRILSQLDQPLNHSQRQLVLHVLQAIDGQMRGVSREDWQAEIIKPPQTVDGHILEAEWASDIKPNYQIDLFQGVRCLALGEGGGGNMQWLKSQDGTVDIGTARFSFRVPEDGAYKIWARVYLDDKCGNSFGFYLNNKQLSNFPDYQNILDRWHWLPLLDGGKETIALKKGFSQIRLEAWEDSVFIDKFALLKPGDKPEDHRDAVVEYWDPGQLAAISFSLEKQAQTRGTKQKITVWVRRNSLDMREGTLTLEPPDGFRLVSPNPTTISFATGNPLARTTFEIELPQEAQIGEGVLRATYREKDKAKKIPDVENEFILAAQYDWLTTGPLEKQSPECQKLLSAKSVSDADLAKWARYPESGYDRYRRLNPEMAWGALSNRYMFFCTDINVETPGTYTIMLTADDQASVWQDGHLLAAQTRNGPGEGRMVTETKEFAAGKHRVFVRLFQTKAKDPEGETAGRKSQNNCCFKLIIRKSRHLPAPQIKGLPMNGFVRKTETSREHSAKNNNG